MRIRAATDDDAVAVAALWTEGYSGRGGGEGRQDPYSESDYADSARRGRVFVAEGGGPAGDGTLAGVIVFFPLGAATWEVGPREAGLSRLVVGEGAQGRGVGRGLVELCIAQAHEAGAETGCPLEPFLPARCPPALRVAGLQAGSPARLDRRRRRSLGLRARPRRAVIGPALAAGVAGLLHFRCAGRARFRTDLHALPAGDRAARRR